MAPSRRTTFHMTIKSITSPNNQRVKDAVKLRDRRQRGKQQRCFIDGAREILLAIEAEVRLVESFVCEPLCNSPESFRALERLGQQHATMWHVTPDVFEKLAFGQRQEGVLAVAETPRRTIGELIVPDGSLVAVVCGLEKPGNVGAVLRSGDATGVAAVIVADGGTDLYNPNCIRTAWAPSSRCRCAKPPPPKRLAGCASVNRKSSHPGSTRREDTPTSITAATRRSCWEAKRPVCRNPGKPPTSRPSNCRCSAKPTA